METRYAPDQVRFEMMNTEELRESFLIPLFEEGEIEMVYSDIDRVIVGSAVPKVETLELKAGKELAADYFCQRREIGVLNIGGDGAITCDGTEYPMVKLDCLYIGKGTKDVSFASKDASNPAKFYIVSYPAHAAFPTTHAPLSQATPVTLGSSDECNERTIYKYIHPDGIKSSQLVMGCTLMKKGSVWNTMPAHTHERRSEVYMYFDVPKDAVVFKLIGMPTETRHIVVTDGQAVITPSWSIHSGCGTNNYSFCWAMGGENQAFGDMDGIAVPDML